MPHSILPRVLSLIHWLSKLLASHLGLESHRVSTNKSVVSTKEDVIPLPLKREPFGYYKFRNGLLNVTPINPDEEYLVKQNTKNSPILRLPREIRDIIWQYTLTSAPIRPCSDLYTPWPHPAATDKFPLLRVCRQIYAETAHLPYSLNTISFAELGDLSTGPESKTGRLDLMQKISFAAILPDPFKSEKCVRFCPIQNMAACRTVDITICDCEKRGWEPQEVEYLVRLFCDGKEVSVRFMENFSDWLDERSAGAMV